MVQSTLLAAELFSLLKSNSLVGAWTAAHLPRRQGDRRVLDMGVRLRATVTRVDGD